MSYEETERKRHEMYENVRSSLEPTAAVLDHAFSSVVDTSAAISLKRIADALEAIVPALIKLANPILHGGYAENGQ